MKLVVEKMEKASCIKIWIILKYLQKFFCFKGNLPQNTFTKRGKIVYIGVFVQESLKYQRQIKSGGQVKL